MIREQGAGGGGVDDVSTRCVQKKLRVLSTIIFRYYCFSKNVFRNNFFRPYFPFIQSSVFLVILKILVGGHALVILVDKHALVILLDKHALVILVDKHALVILVDKHALVILVDKHAHDAPR